MYFAVVAGYRVRVWSRSRNVRSRPSDSLKPSVPNVWMRSRICNNDSRAGWTGYDDRLNVLGTGGGALWGTTSFEIGESSFFIEILNIRGPVAYRERVETFDASWAPLTTRSWQVSKQIKIQMNELYGNVMAHTHNLYMYIYAHTHIYI